jgi:hypothetical protein
MARMVEAPVTAEVLPSDIILGVSLLEVQNGQYGSLARKRFRQ